MNEYPGAPIKMKYFQNPRLEMRSVELLSSQRACILTSSRGDSSWARLGRPGLNDLWKAIFLSKSGFSSVARVERYFEMGKRTNMRLR